MHLIMAILLNVMKGARRKFQVSQRHNMLHTIFSSPVKCVQNVTATHFCTACFVSTVG